MPRHARFPRVSWHSVGSVHLGIVLIRRKDSGEIDHYWTGLYVNGHSCYVSDKLVNPQKKLIHRHFNQSIHQYVAQGSSCLPTEMSLITKFFLALLLICISFQTAMADSNTNITFKDSRWTFHATSNDSVKYEENLDRVTIHASSKQDWWKTAPGSVPESNVDRRTGPLYMLRHDSLGKQENWTAGVWLEGIEFKEVFQQAALFVGQGDTPESLTSWLKAGIELDGGEQKIGCVAKRTHKAQSVIADCLYSTQPPL